MLSGGMKQRVAIARAMALEPKVLLMDEPFAALDALTRNQMQDELRRLWEDVGFTLIFVTHSIEEAIVVGSRVLLLSPHPGQVPGGTERAAGVGRAAWRRGPDHPGGIASTICCSAHHRCLVRGRRAAMADARLHPVERPEFVREIENPGNDVDAAVALTPWERLYRMDAVRQTTLLVVLAAIWQAYAVLVANPLILPTFTDTMVALWNDVVDGPLRAAPGRRSSSC